MTGGPWTLEYAIEIARTAAGRKGYRTYPGGGSIWCGRNDASPDASFVDWGLAVATATILNAVVNGGLVPAEDAARPSRSPSETSGMGESK